MTEAQSCLLGETGEIVGEFVLETTDQLADVGGRLIEREGARTPSRSSGETLDALWRAFRLRTGRGDFPGVDGPVDVSHGPEAMLDRLGRGSLSPSCDVIIVLCSAPDFIGASR